MAIGSATPKNKPKKPDQDLFAPIDEADDIPEQSTPAKTVSDLPLFKFTESKKPAVSPVFKIGAAFLIFVVIIYIIGVLTNQFIFTLAAFVVAIVGMFVVLFANRRYRRLNKLQRRENIDAEVELFKEDLIATFKENDVKYTAQDVLDAADKYRETLLVEDASVIDMDPSSVKTIAKSMTSHGDKAEKKARRRQIKRARRGK